VAEQAAVVNEVWVLDAMCLSHFARADRLDVLRDLLVDKECWTTQGVLEEVSRGAAAHPGLNDILAADWFKIAQLDTLNEIRHFALWADRLGSGERDLGKASVFAVAELRKERHRPHHRLQRPAAGVAAPFSSSAWPSLSSR
jgi:hypothetical protein